MTSEFDSDEFLDHQDHNVDIELLNHDMANVERPAMNEE
jgi:hypothetical protein